MTDGIIQKVFRRYETFDSAYNELTRKIEQELIEEIKKIKYQDEYDNYSVDLEKLIGEKITIFDLGESD